MANQLNIPKNAGNSRLKRVLLAAFVVAAGLGTYFYMRAQAEPTVELYRTAPAERRSLVQLVEATGRLDVRKRVEVPAPVGGRLMAINVYPARW